MDYKPGADIFSMDVECIINPVNCQAHKLQPGWQKGLAGAFEKRFPEVQEPFKKACREGTLKPGGVQMIKVDRKTGRRDPKGDGVIANVATKDHWRDASRIEWVDDGLRKLAGAIESRGISSVAIPQLGSGLGGLPWKDVRASIDKHFTPLSKKGISVIVLGESDEQERKRLSEPFPPRIDIDEPEDVKYVAGIGARDTPESELKKMGKVSRILASQGCVLRSGGAEGADEHCEKGWDAVGGKKQIFLSWKGMNDRQPNGKDVFCFDYSKDCPEVEIAKSYYHRSKMLPNGDAKRWAKLGRGGKAHMSRNTNQVLGPNVGKSPVTSAILCWTERGAVKGGTGQALRIANDKGIPVVNLGDQALKGLGAEEIAGFTMALMDGAKREDALKEAWSAKKKSAPQVR
jgi:O-acetyl-ADP-ribose deacetylase (regulator of RNase III)